MRAKYFITRRLYIFFVAVTCILFNGCTSDDEDEVIPRTFLEKFNDTKWVANDEGMVLYLRVNNKLRVPFEIWAREMDLEKSNVTETCYGHQDDWMGEGVEITENFGNRFTISYLDMEFWTLEIRDETLTLTFYNIGGHSDSAIFEKTTVNVDAFEICPES